MNHQAFIEKTIELAVENLNTKGGGPFAAIVVDQNGTVVATGQNKVTSSNDPTAHAEIQAIRKACEKLQTFQLTGCTLYTSCEPCPMCLGAVYWARLDQVYFAANQEAAAAGGFDDKYIYEEINKKHEERMIPFYSIDSKNMNVPFEKWKTLAVKVEY
ncbi:nucleoside deaminase [Jeotgalibacillus proteolyticus]|uniref:nucleoside deaminase n=1 Tax=Jeotgalibacillus proteolyticus TaxID=2082395 RepID=UPI003CF34F78